MKFPLAGCVCLILACAPRDSNAEPFSCRRCGADQLVRVSLRQSAITDAPVVMVITAVPSRIESRHGNLAPRFIAMEAGHAAQNVDLQRVPLGIGTVVIGAVDEVGVSEVLQLSHSERPLYILPIGKLSTVSIQGFDGIGSPQRSS